ncbi:hypothetical protein I79_022346 [Cricetulus griseus]|uniref:Uncharacterized protein n=1 Tax=Cricetulus griseus TaxID=10029 RepID=G3IF33_CRIGR|nr:hypothetical protein I79_022346 [Cricetulus griseus]
MSQEEKVKAGRKGEIRKEVRGLGLEKGRAMTECKMWESNTGSENITVCSLSILLT